MERGTSVLLQRANIPDEDGKRTVCISGKILEFIGKQGELSCVRTSADGGGLLKVDYTPKGERIKIESFGKMKDISCELPPAPEPQPEPQPTPEPPPARPKPKKNPCISNLEGYLTETERPARFEIMKKASILIITRAGVPDDEDKKAICFSVQAQTVLNQFDDLTCVRTRLEDGILTLDYTRRTQRLVKKTFGTIEQLACEQPAPPAPLVTPPPPAPAPPPAKPAPPQPVVPPPCQTNLLGYHSWDKPERRVKLDGVSADMLKGLGIQDEKGLKATSIGACLYKYFEANEPVGLTCLHVSGERAGDIHLASVTLPDDKGAEKSEKKKIGTIPEWEAGSCEPPPAPSAPQVIGSTVPAPPVPGGFSPRSFPDITVPSGSPGGGGGGGGLGGGGSPGGGSPGGGGGGPPGASPGGGGGGGGSPSPAPASPSPSPSSPPPAAGPSPSPAATPSPGGSSPSPGRTDSPKDKPSPAPAAGPAGPPGIGPTTPSPGYPGGFGPFGGGSGFGPGIPGFQDRPISLRTAGGPAGSPDLPERRRPADTKSAIAAESVIPGYVAPPGSPALRPPDDIRDALSAAPVRVRKPRPVKTKTSAHPARKPGVNCPPVPPCPGIPLWEDAPLDWTTGCFPIKLRPEPGFGGLYRRVKARVAAAFVRTPPPAPSEPTPEDLRDALGQSVGRTRWGFPVLVPPTPAPAPTSPACPVVECKGVFLFVEAPPGYTIGCFPMELEERYRRQAEDDRRSQLLAAAAGLLAGGFILVLIYLRRRKKKDDRRPGTPPGAPKP
ncbi:MAG: hypothetical protein HY078_10730 [Elusimicrobia bacterium]|nr:hypothetical protein [Elusimicrobiota bacterium]